MSELVAALDIGTNSFHLVIAKPVPGGFEVVTREKDVVRLGHGGGDMKQLSEEAIGRGVKSLARMAEIASSHGAEVRAVATSAVREAKNRSEFIKQVRKATGIDIEVISGVEEARLIHLGVLNAIGIHDQSMFVCDIGGGSTEVVVGLDDEVMFARSFKLGAVRLTDRFFAGTTLHPSAIPSCRSFIRSSLSVVAPEVMELGFEAVATSSGTAETIARIILHTRGASEPKSMNRFEFSADEVRSVVTALQSAPTIDERVKRFGLEPNRADIILAGALILEGVVDVFELKSLMFSDYALREGLLLDTLRREGLIEVDDDHDAARRSVQQLADRCDDRPEHSQHVAELAIQLFEQLEEPLNLQPEWRRYLEFASLLANVGVVVSHAKHHLHSYYLIRNSELMGLTDREVEIIAQVARYHRKSVPKTEHTEFSALSSTDQRIVQHLAGILRIAIGLDRTYDARVKTISVKVSTSELLITAKSRGKKNDISLNLYAANERKGLLADISKRKVKLSEA
ncbi:MAG: Ppx/GppA phosphatase family protein [Ilumatobacteraceae bacterium]|jgi:exopolyphosphatase/guanosine-5'-triphosphate,3'-diphosphate pyrophosphatase|nr:exopolyphosphatase [Actinomycetes bacterium]